MLSASGRDIPWRSRLVLIIISGCAAVAGLATAQVVHSVTPTSGSPLGGTRVVLTGDSLPFPWNSSTHRVLMDDIPCMVDERAATPWFVPCLTAPFPGAAPKLVNVSVVSPFGSLPCSGNCTFTYTSGTVDGVLVRAVVHVPGKGRKPVLSADSEPKVTTVWPSQVSPASLLYLQGKIQDFGADSLRITVGNASCTLRDDRGDSLSAVYAPSLPLTNNSTVACKVPDVPAGLYNVSVTIPQYGVGSPTGTALRSNGLDQLFMVEQRAIVSGISPVKVSVAGGVPIAIQGSGFSLSPPDNAVVIGGVVCPVTFATTTTLQVMAPALSSVNFATQCIGRSSGGNVSAPAAGLGAVNAGPRGVRYQAWLPLNVPNTTVAISDVRFHPRCVPCDDVVVFPLDVGNNVLVA
jgi:hypothetical protein